MLDAGIQLGCASQKEYDYLSKRSPFGEKIWR
jgi:hypothetical protein